MKVRLAIPSDKKRILEISNTIWDGEDYVSNIIDNWINHENGFLAVCEYNNTVVGFAKFTIIKNNDFWLEGIRADKNYKNLGIGSAITKFFITEAKKRKYQRLALSTYIENYQSIHIIEKYGFKPKHYFKFLYAEPNILRKAPHYNKVKNFNHALKIFDSSKLIAQNNLIHFDWSFITLDSQLLKFLFDRGDIYFYNDSFLILSKYKNKTNDYSVSFISDNINNALSFSLNKAYLENKTISIMANPNDNINKFIKPLDLEEGVKGSIYDTIYYEYLP